MTTEQGIYPINNPDEKSPVLITSNFSLTYFIVSGEVESSRVPAWLLVLNTDGLSVLTAWAAEKFTPEKISESLNKFAVGDLVKHKNVVIPGYVAVMSGDLEEQSGWKVVVGPKEAAGLRLTMDKLESQIDDLNLSFWVLDDARWTPAPTQIPLPP